MSTPYEWITTPIGPDILCGALDLEHTERGVLPHRLPAHARAQIPDGQLAMAESQPSGSGWPSAAGPPPSNWT